MKKNTKSGYMRQLPPIQTYSISKICSNCGVDNQLEIPRGTLISEYMQGKHCDNCGCRLAGNYFWPESPRFTMMAEKPYLLDKKSLEILKDMRTYVWKPTKVDKNFPKKP